MKSSIMNLISSRVGATSRSRQSRPGGLSHNLARAAGTILAGLFLLATSACIRINSDELGICVINVPGIHRVVQETRTTGYYLNIPYAFTYYKFPRTQMTLDMVEKGNIQFKTAGPSVETRKMAAKQEANQPLVPEEQMEQVNQEISESDRIQIVVHERRTGAQSVWVKTADGNDAWVDVIVTYQIVPDQAWQVVYKIGDSQEDIANLVASMVRGTIRAWLGELDTKEILRAKDREDQVEGMPQRDKAGMIVLDQWGRPVKEVRGAIDSLNDRLGKFGIEIVKLSAPSVTIHPDYEAVLSKKRIAEEERDEYISYQEKAVEEKQTKVNTARGEADAMIELARGRLQRTRQEADAELEAKHNEAEGLRVKYNELATGIAAQTAQLGGPGGDAQVGLAISQAMQGKKIIVVPSSGAMNLLDVNELIQSFGAARVLNPPSIVKPSPATNQPAQNLAPAEQNVPAQQK